VPAWEIKGFGGMVPLLDPRLLNDYMAEAAVNCDFTSGQLHGLFAPVLVHDFSGFAGPVEKAYLFVVEGEELWVPLPSKFTSVVRSPLANDDRHRLYWTSPGELTPKWSTFERIKNGLPPYALGTLQPSTALTITSTSGGTASVPEISRSYVYTWLNEIGEESAPSPPSNVFDGPPDATWVVTGLPTSAPANPADRNYPPITGLVLYRTVTGIDTGTQYYEVTRFTYPPGPTNPYSDSIADDDITGHLILQSGGWENPPDFLDGLTSLPGGMMVGWTGNTIHFCEPDRPHTWPSFYDQSVHYEIIALAVWQQYLMILTTGYPSTGSGNSPSNFIIVQSQVPEPCVSRGSVVADLLAVYYASQNGLIQISGYGMSNQTQQLVDKEKWQEVYHADQIYCARHRTQYLAINGTDKAFVLDYSDPRLAFQDLSTFKNATSVWNDEYFGDTYICAEKKVYRWDDTDQARLKFRWRSKRFFAPVPISLGAVQVTLGPEIDTVFHGQFPPPPLDNGDPSLALPDGVWGVVRYYAGPDFSLIMEHHLRYQQDFFRLPKGFRAFDHQIEIVSMVSVYSVQLGTTMTELRSV
jgi:hypothetical protein